MVKRDLIDALLSLSNALKSVSNNDNKITTENKKPEVVLFFSFDIVNSTEYKSINYFGWAKVINNLFKEIRKRVDEEIIGAEMWRVLGDEAIFIVKVRQEETLQQYTNRIFKILTDTIFHIKNGDYFKDKGEEIQKLQNILSLKAAAWIAIVNDVGNVDSNNLSPDENENIFERYQSLTGISSYQIFEFLGNDIDAGFRISKQTLDGRFVLSYELAYLISLRTESLSYLNIITYRRLKGIWKNKLYPIIWYHDSEAYIENYGKEIRFDDSFSYDACDESDLIKEYFLNKDINHNDDIIREKRMFSDAHYALEKIKKDRKMSRKIDKIKEVMNESTLVQTKYINPELMQIHCAAVCYKVIDGSIQILVFKRSSRRKKMPGVWEFGCSKATIDKSISEKLIEEYKNDFGLNIKPVCDTERTMSEPIPIALYRVVHEETAISDSKTDKGIIVLAEIEDEIDIQSLKLTDKHEEAKWIDESNVDSINIRFSNAVPDFEATIRKAIKMIHSISDSEDTK